MEKIQHLKISFKKIKRATKKFDNQNLIAHGGLGSLYKGELSSSDGLIAVVVKRLDPDPEYDIPQFLMWVTILSSCRHKNLVSLIGFCQEGREKVLVFEHESRGSLNSYINNPDLTWMQRLKISIGAARGLSYLHDKMVVHRDVKSASILLTEDWEAKVSGFNSSYIRPQNLQQTNDVSGGAGTFGYLDPSYFKTGLQTKESDVYSFGVVLFEIMCGRLSFEQGSMFLGPLAIRMYKSNKMDAIIIPELRKQMKLNSLNTFSNIAFQCFNFEPSERPTIAQIIDQLEFAYKLQVSLKIPGSVRVGIWGTKSTGDPTKQWSFQLEKNHHLKKITIDHGHLIYSLMFTTEFRGVERASEKFSGWNVGDVVSEVTFAWEEEMIAISGTVGVDSRGIYPGNSSLLSLTFITNKNIHGPYGCATGGMSFTVPWEKKSLAGFYGVAGYYIEGIGVYLKETILETIVN